MSSEIPTPRTDAETYDFTIHGDAWSERTLYPEGAGDHVEADFARTLERELATALRERDEAREACKIS